MKKCASLLLIIVSLFTISGVHAQMPVSSGEMHPPIEIGPEISPVDVLPPTLPVFGQDHAYGVTLRQNGEGIVNMRVAFSNFDPGSLDTLVLKSKSMIPTEVAAFQIIKEQVCKQFDTSTKEFSGSYGEVQRCLSYDEPNYFETWGVNNTYLRAEAEVADNSITIKLPQAVEEGKSGSYVLFMRIPEVSKKSFGGTYEYSFETFTTDTAIRNITIGISSDTDMIFKGAEGMVAYQDQMMRTTFESAVSSKQPSFRSPDFDNYVYQIGYGQMNKSTQNLLAGDTYKVQGMMGKTVVNLYLKEGLVVISCIFAIFGIMIGIVLLVSKKRKNSDDRQPISSTKLFLLSLSLSFVSGLLMVGLTLALLAVTKMFETWGIYGQGMFVFLFVAIVSFGLYAVLLLAPAVFMWLKYGKKWAAISFGFTFFWIMIFLVVVGIYVMFTGMFGSGNMIEPAVGTYGVSKTSL